MNSRSCLYSQIPIEPQGKLVGNRSLNCAKVLVTCGVALIDKLKLQSTYRLPCGFKPKERTVDSFCRISLNHIIQQFFFNIQKPSTRVSTEKIRHASQKRFCVAMPNSDFKHDRWGLTVSCGTNSTIKIIKNLNELLELCNYSLDFPCDKRKHWDYVESGIIYVSLSFVFICEFLSR